ncbi:ABC transporter permease [Aliidongia dinghuensis]|uniref:ABC transporter permease n=1 Tax=Aliidongia dinghuensis TaxID=1867774 RepID=A0A8J2YXM2_9PROT|nr:ABC transporter permease [Aliidongia dinghuensis]GGF32846.1 ABC transporter permease [Aliidongia dinghuensis]
MFGNYLSAALGNLVRNKLHAAINLFGLALGLATAILIGLYVRDEVTFERFLPDYEQVYRMQSVDTDTDGRTMTFASTPHGLAALLRESFPELAEVTRVMGGTYGVRHDQIEATESMQSADPNFFKVLGFKLIKGTPDTALATPDSIALSRAMALKYFGTEDCLGQTLELDHSITVRVGAVFEDLPSNTQLHGLQAFLSSLVPVSTLAKADKLPPPLPGEYNTDSNIYVRLKPGASIATVDARLPAFIDAHYPQDQSGAPPRSGFLEPIASIHLHGRELGDYNNSSDLATVYAISATGVLVLVVAGINFVNLVTARATRRALEVGVRKAAGATRRQLIGQFMGESVAYALAALVLAAALVELALPGFNGFLDRTITFAYWRDPLLFVGLPLLAIAIGLIAGFYPALVLSSFRPATVLKGAAAAQGSGTLRQVLVVLQYAISITLLIATAIIYRQTEFATSDSLHFDKNLIVAVSLDGIPGRASPDGLFSHDQATVGRMRDRFAALPGVKAVADSWVIPDAHSMSSTTWHLNGDPAGRAIIAGRVTQGFGFFELYGIKPITGRSFGRDHGDDATPEQAGVEGTAVLNMSAVKLFGFASPEKAIGQELAMDIEGNNGSQPRRIVGVVPDFPLSTIRAPIRPSVFLVEPDWSNYLNIKLTGDRVPETLAAIDRIWQEMVTTRPIQRQFVDDRIEKLYRDVTRQGQVFAGFALVAVLIACLGLFGLAAFTAERRTKEIGIRKAMGASTTDILKLLIWEFAKPVLLANAIAWPLAYLVMTRWLDGFAYRISLNPLVFLGSAAVALAIASGTTLYHALQVARRRPVLALRYE